MGGSRFLLYLPPLYNIRQDINLCSWIFYNPPSVPQKKMAKFYEGVFYKAHHYPSILKTIVSMQEPCRCNCTTFCDINNTNLLYIVHLQCTPPKYGHFRKVSCPVTCFKMCHILYLYMKTQSCFFHF